MTITFVEITINRCLGVIHTLIVAVVNDRSRHTAEDRFDHIKELRASRKRRRFNERAARFHHKLIVLLYPLE